jgi:hypothetical protein
MKRRDAILGWGLVLLGFLLLLLSGKIGLLIVVIPAAILLAFGVAGNPEESFPERRVK